VTPAVIPAVDEEDGAETAICPARGLAILLRTYNEPPFRTAAIPRVERKRDIIIKKKESKKNRIDHAPQRTQSSSCVTALLPHPDAELDLPPQGGDGRAEIIGIAIYKILYLQQCSNFRTELMRGIEVS
jgi:hypothetical protein